MEHFPRFFKHFVMIINFFINRWINNNFKLFSSELHTSDLKAVPAIIILPLFGDWEAESEFQTCLNYSCGENYSEDKIINVSLEEGIRVITLSDMYSYCHKQRIKKRKS